MREAKLFLADLVRVERKLANGHRAVLPRVAVVNPHKVGDARDAALRAVALVCTRT